MTAKNYNVRTLAEETYVTPLWLVQAILQVRGDYFDLDPCCPPTMPWFFARRMLTKKDDGLAQQWSPSASIWLNPPYGAETKKWMKKVSEHEGGGMALIFAHTDTQWFHDYVFNRAEAMLFLKGRLTFAHPDGTPCAGNAPAPSVLVAYKKDCAAQLALFSRIHKDKGAFQWTTLR